MKYKEARTLNGVKVVTQTDIDNALYEASSLSRARKPILIHDSFENVPQRFINCLNTNSYVRPHMHNLPEQWELMSWLSGDLVAVFFDENGVVTNKILMNKDNTKVIEIPALCYHSFVAIKHGSYLEIRNCKYQPKIDRVYAAWSPEEDSTLATSYQSKLLTTKVGESLII